MEHGDHGHAAHDGTIGATPPPHHLPPSPPVTAAPSTALANSRLHGDMMMYFHGGYNETILFQTWTIDSVGGLVGSMVGIFFICLLYEGLKFFRDHLMRRSYSSLPYNNVPSAGAENGDSPSPDDRNSRRREVVKIIQTEIFSGHHCLQTLLQMVQTILSYFIMLIFMTFNSWLCGAVVLGLTVGYFMFGWRKAVVLEGPDHCH